MKRKIVLIVTAIIVLVMGTAAKCPAKTPKVQKSLCTDKTCAVVYNDKEGRNLLVYIEKAKFGNCEPGKRWPNCTEGDISRGMRNIPYNANPDINKELTKQNIRSDGKAVCVSSVSHPEATITNTWFIGEMDAKTEEPEVMGIFQRCDIGLPGQTAYIKSEHHAVPSTLMCNVFWVTADGEKIVLDFVITQAFGDCVAQGLVP